MPAAAADRHAHHDLRGDLTADRVAAPKDGRETPSLGTEKSRTWVKPDGSRVTRIWNRPVNVKTAKGWEAIDNSLKASGAGGFLKGEGGYDLRVPSTLADPLRLRDGDRFIELRLQGSTAAAKVAGAKAVFAGAGKGATLEVTAFDDAIKEDLVLSGPDSQSSFTYDVGLSEGLKLELREDGGADVVDTDGEVAFAIPAPVAQDAKGAIAAEGDASLSYEDGKLTVSLSKEWLTEQGRAFPVRLDPSAVLGATRDTFTDEITPTTGYATGGDLYAGRESAGHDHNALTYFNVAGAIPAGAFVQEAELSLWPKFETASTGTKNLEARAITADWDSNATWVKRNATTNWGTAGGDFGGVLDTEPIGAYAWKRFTITDTVNTWLDGSATNRGIAITDGASTVDRAVAFASSEWTDAAARPYLEIQYFPRAGALANNTIQEQAISDRQTLGVNVAGGNLLLQSNDLNVAAKGLPVAISRYYNSADDWTGQFGQGGRISLGNDIVLYECDRLGSRCLIGPSGFRARFKFNGTDTYVTPANIGNFTLKRATATSGNFTLIDNANGTKWNFFDNSFSFNNQITDRYGNSLSFDASNPNGSLSKITDANGRQYPVTTDSAGRITKIEVPSAQFAGGVVWQYAYNSYGFMTSVTDPEGNVTQYAYGSNDKINTITDGRGNETLIAYDAHNRVTSVTRKIDGTTTNDVTTTYAYVAVDADCTLTSSSGEAVVGKTLVTDPNGNVTKYCYGQSGAVLKAINAKTQVTATTYTSSGNVSKITGFSGTGNFEQQFQFDTGPGLEYNLKQATGGEGELTQYEYLAAGSDPLQKYRVDYVTDPQGNVTDFTYDADGNVTSVDNSATGTGTQQVQSLFNTTVGSPLRGTMTWSKDGNANQTSYGYDSLARLQTITTANPTALPTTTMTYDGLSRLKTVTDGRGKVTTYHYDKLDRIVSVVDNATITQTFGYDGNGNNTYRTEPGKTSSYTYDKLNRKTGESFPGDSSNYTWDKGSNLKTLTDLGGTSTYYYDELNRMNRIDGPAVSGSDTTTFSWTEPTTLGTTSSWRTTTLPGGGKIKETIDRSGKLTETLVTNSSTAQTLKRTYGYILSSDPTRKRAMLVTGTEQAGAAGTVTNKSYGYDSSGRLIEAKTMDGSFTQTAKDTFEYDGAGNRLRRTRITGAATSYTSYGYNNLNQLCWKSATNVATPTCGTVPGGATSYAYDQAGNQTSGDVSATYDVKGRLASLGGASFTHLSPTNWELTAAGTSSYRNNLLGVGYIDAAGNVSKLQRSPDDGTVISQVRDSAKRWFVTDQIGSTIALIDSTGAVQRTYAYDTDGVDTTSGTGPATFIKFAGGHDVGNGLYHFGARYYQPSIARWTQMDPVLQPMDLGQANRYSYVGNNAVNAIDPNGQWLWLLRFGAKVLYDKAKKKFGEQIAKAAGAVGKECVEALLDSTIDTTKTGVGKVIANCGYDFYYKFFK